MPLRKLSWMLFIAILSSSAFSAAPPVRTAPASAKSPAAVSKARPPSFSPLAEPSSLKSQFAVGLNVTGAGLRYGVSRRCALDLRWQTGRADSEAGKTDADAFGLRATRFFSAGRRWRSYGGVEVAWLRSKTDGAGEKFKTSGYASGAFAGIEYYVMRNLSLAVDAGPYFAAAKEKTTKASSSGVDVVLNSAVHFYLF